MFVDNYISEPGSAIAANGEVVQHFVGRFFDPGMRRPYFDSQDRVCVTVNTGRWTREKGARVPVRERKPIRDLILDGIIPPVFNATALRKEEWIELDKQVLEAATYETRAWSDLAQRNPYGGFNGMGKMMLEHETMSDPGEAIVDMDALTEGRTDSPRFQLEGLPLPITHSDFHYDSRRLAISQNSGMPLSTISGMSAGKRIGEMLEATTIGTRTGVTYGGGSSTPTYGRTASVYGYTNFPQRITKTNLTAPTGTNAATTLSEVLAMRDSLYLRKFKGPFMLYHSNDWDQYMDNDYTLSGGNVTTSTLRSRLKQIDGIADVKRLDMLFGTQLQTNPYYTSSTIGTTGQLIYAGPGADVDVTLKPTRLLMISMSPMTARAVNGMDLVTMQWEEKGGMRLCYKAMTIQVPQLRADFYGNCGILDATTS